MNKTSIALFASGTGTNAVNLINHFKNNDVIEVALVVCNKADAPVVEKSKALGVEVLVVSNDEVENGLTLLQELDYRAIKWIILAGFLRKIPLNILRGYHNRIINVHPALLPKFGGQGMYGMNVHKAVVEACEMKSGISIHLVNEEFDKGELLAQFEVELLSDDTPEKVAEKVQVLEHRYFPEVVEKIIRDDGRRL
jgi:phosphoribosylglycinamide formyltransferase 1